MRECDHAPDHGTASAFGARGRDDGLSGSVGAASSAWDEPGGGCTPDRMVETVSGGDEAHPRQASAVAEGRLALAPHYALLRRALAQTAGLMLIHRAGRTTTRDEIACVLEAVGSECAQALDGLESLTLPASLRRTHAELRQAAHLVTLAIESVRRSLGPGSSGIEQADCGIAPLRQAHRLMANASDDRYGMAMASFAHACCGGARRTPRLAVANSAVSGWPSA